MSNIEKMKRVDDLFNQMAEILGYLTGEGVFTEQKALEMLVDNFKIQTKWMNENFTNEEISQFAKEVKVNL